MRADPEGRHIEGSVMKRRKKHWEADRLEGRGPINPKTGRRYSNPPISLIYLAYIGGAPQSAAKAAFQSGNPAIPLIVVETLRSGDAVITPIFSIARATHGQPIPVTSRNELLRKLKSLKGLFKNKLRVPENFKIPDLPGA